jgi:hypothetical protein
MGLDKYQHTTKEIDGVNYRILEGAITKSRAEFLQKLLEHNGLETKIETDPPKEGQEQTYTLITADVTFNPVVKVYNRELRTPEGHRVTPDYWNQLTTKLEPNYWDRDKKEFLK